MNKFKEIEERLLQFSVDLINFRKTFDKSDTSMHLGNQLMRSGTSVSLNFGEARGAASDRDFTNKFKIIVKELRESRMNLEIIDRVSLSKDQSRAKQLGQECDELIAIFTSSIKTLELKAKQG